MHHTGISSGLQALPDADIFHIVAGKISLFPSPVQIPGYLALSLGRQEKAAAGL